MCSFVHSCIHSFNTISLLTLCLTVGCSLYVTGSLSRAGVSWPVQTFFPLPFPMMSMSKYKVRWGGRAVKRSWGGGSVSSDPTRFMLAKLADQGPCLLPLIQKLSTCHLRSLDTGGIPALSAAASFKSGKQQEAGWLLQVVSCLPQEASGNLSRFLPSPSKLPGFKEAPS